MFTIPSAPSSSSRDRRSGRLTPEWMYSGGIVETFLYVEQKERAAPITGPARAAVVFPLLLPRAAGDRPAPRHGQGQAGRKSRQEFDAPLARSNQLGEVCATA